MPYPNEHSARIKDPSLFKTGKGNWGSQELKPGLRRIAGRLKSNNEWETQAYRFDRTKFTPKQARDWLKENDIKYISFEVATGEKKAVTKKVALRYIRRFLKNSEKK